MHKNIDPEKMHQLFNYDKDNGLITRKAAKGVKAKSMAMAGTVASAGYVTIFIDGGQYLAHRIAWVMHHGTQPTGQIDHINGNRVDNRIDNLRDVTHSTNQQNKYKANLTNKCGVLGVSGSRGRFRAFISKEGKQIYIGSFKTKELAHTAYLDAKRKLHEGCML